ncbi:MAG: metal ABC transporter permease [Anaerolineaceae bacterium]|nr:metal ABC transporter permease [Anaerolineaceae bacterium]
MIQWLLEPLTYTFMQRGMLAALMVGMLCAVIGCYVVLRSMAFLGDALAHSILPGIAVAYLLQGNLILGALAAAVIVALGISFFTRNGAIREDTAIGILFAAALSFGVLLISTIRSYAVDLSHILFGNVLGVGPQDLWLTAALGLVVLACVLIFYRPFLVVSFDPVLASTLGMRTGWLRTLMLLLISLTVVVSMQTVGVGLVAAMLVTPAATAYLLARRLPAMMLISAAIGGISSLAGLYLSYYLNVASGAAVVLTATGIFLVVFLFNPRRGLAWRWRSSPANG